MDRTELAESLTAALRVGEVVECELGVFFVVVWPASIGRNPRTGGAVAVPAKHVPTFVPSDALLARAGGERASTSAAHREALARDLVGTFDLVTGERVLSDPNDEHVPIRVPERTRRLEVGALFDDVAASLAEKKKAVIPGVGKLRRTKTARGPRRGQLGVTFVPSAVLKAALAER